ncbi:response regulator transcription factor [Pontiellaceae bacterium B12219]|nr:response regulator transcription factor [Pontiellaceae bacterium B12219]
MKSLIKVMLIEDHAGYREVIARALKGEEKIELISQFTTAEIALRSLQDMTTRIEPDLLLLDLNLPGISGLEALPFFKQTIPSLKVIILTQSDNQNDVLKAISLGAKGYLLKSATVTQIKDGINTVMNGGATLDPQVARFILDTLAKRTDKVPLEKELSSRELEILILIGEGLLKKEIADQLGIAFTTVADHVRHIYEKLEVQNAAAAVNKAHRLGIFSPEP